MTKYEIMFIVKATLEETALNNITKEVQKLITDNNSKVIEFKDMGRKKLAYPINKEINGFYYLMNVEATTEAIQEFDRRVKINENILRHLILKTESE
ncbi:MAG: 30S ribosomal protein S6 [Firmicutes bacterium]|nr:30S ribosomal protein S6 [Bacillota bacterium]